MHLRAGVRAGMDSMAAGEWLVMYELRKVDQTGLPDGAKGGVVASQEVWEEGGIKKPPPE